MMPRPFPRWPHPYYGEESSTVHPPNPVFAFDEAPTMIQQYTQLLKEKNGRFRREIGNPTNEQQIGLGVFLRESRATLYYLEQVMTQTLIVLHEPNFGERGSRCFVEHHVFTAHHLLHGVLTCLQFIGNAYEHPKRDHEGVSLWPEGCYHQLNRLADAHGRASQQQYHGDNDVEEYTGDGPKAVLRDISVEAGQLIRELVATAQALIAFYDWLWPVIARDKHPALSDAVDMS